MFKFKDWGWEIILKRLRDVLSSKQVSVSDVDSPSPIFLKFSFKYWIFQSRNPPTPHLLQLQIKRTLGINRWYLTLGLEPVYPAKNTTTSVSLRNLFYIHHARFLEQAILHAYQTSWKECKRECNSWYCCLDTSLPDGLSVWWCELLQKCSFH